MAVSSRLTNPPASRHMRPTGPSGHDRLLAEIDGVVQPHLKISIATQGRLPDGRASYRLPSEVPAIRALAEAGIRDNLDELIELLVPLCLRFDKADLRARIAALDKAKERSPG